MSKCIEESDEDNAVLFLDRDIGLYMKCIGGCLSNKLSISPSEALNNGKKL